MLTGYCVVLKPVALCAIAAHYSDMPCTVNVFTIIPVSRHNWIQSVEAVAELAYFPRFHPILRWFQTNLHLKPHL